MARLTPYLTVDDGAAAIAFYAAALGAEEVGKRYVEADGRIGHATLRIGDDELYLSDESHDYGAYAPKTVGQTTVALMLAVEDVDATYAAAIAAGATVDREPTGAEDGGRRGWFVDPFGHRWGVGTARD